MFAYLIVPALAGIRLARDIVGTGSAWAGLRAAVSVVGMSASATLDLPTGATVVCAFGAGLLLGWAFVRVSGRSFLWRRGVGGHALRPGDNPARGESIQP